MRRAFTILLLLATLSVRAVTNEVNGTFDATSYDTDPSHLWGNYFATAFYSEYPQWTNHIYSWSRGGSDIHGDYAGQEFKRCAPFWNYSSNITVFDWVLADNDNGGYDSNALVSAWSQLASGPPLFWNGTAPTNEGVLFPTVVHIPFGGILADVPDGDSGQLIRNNAETNLAAHAGVPVVDLWHMLATNGWSRDVTNARLLGFYSGGHPFASGHLCMAIKTLQALSVNTNFGIDTNLGSFTLDLSNAVVAATNQCAVTGITRVGNTLTFTVRFDRMPMAWDVPDGVRTNDARNAFVVMPELGSAFQWTIQVTNLAEGNYKIFVDGVLTDYATDTQLAAGRNWFTNYNGPLWAQRVAVLDAKRDQEGADHYTLMAHSAGQPGVLGVGDLVNYESSAGVNNEVYPLIYTGTNYVNYMAPRIADMRRYDVAIWRAAQQTNHVFTIMPADQHIIFPAIGDQEYGVAPITLTATASSGLPVSYEIVSGPATVSSNTVTITGAGSVAIQASQSGDDTWPAAIPVTQVITVAPKTLIGSITADDKIYDGTPDATIATRSVSGVIGADAVTLAGGSGTFPDKSVGIGRTVTVTGLCLAGVDAAKYRLQSTNAITTATIIPVPLNLAEVTAADKVYDGTTVAAISTNDVSLIGVIDGDEVILTGAPTGAFADSDVGAGKMVTVAGFTLDGKDAGNYQLTQPITSASISSASTLTAILSSLNPVPPGSNVNFTATLSVVSPGAGTPTGNITFKDGETTIGSVPLNGLAAALNTDELTHGSHTITAEYPGDGNFVGNTNCLSQLIDTPPAAPTITLQRYLTAGVKVRLADLLTNDTDPDGDALTLLSVNPTCESGATVVADDQWVYYQAPLGLTNADTFSRVVADSFGLQATGLVAVVTVPDTNAPQNFAHRSPGIIDQNGDLHLQFLGIPGRVYTVQYTTNILTQDWQTLGTAAADDSGLIKYIDSVPADSPARIYRTTYP